MAMEIIDKACIMKKILFLHGFFASGQCVPAVALREAFDGRADVIAPDLPLHPHEAVAFIRELIDRERPDLMVGNSCGAFYAQMLAPIVGIPALLGNPHFRMTEFLTQRIGQQQYKSLTQTLRTLEEDGFVSREVFPEVPPRVEYSLTARAHSFLPLVENMINWAKENMDEIIKDRTNNYETDI